MLGDALELLIAKQQELSELLTHVHTDSRTAYNMRKKINAAKDAEIALRKYILFAED
jgi:hypothetical protein